MTNERLGQIPALEIVLYLRQRLLDARDQNEMGTLESLQTVYVVLSDLAYLRKARGLGMILEELESSARDSLMGVPQKSTIPSEEQIRDALQGETD
jgi:hypothetical protein